MDQVKMSAISDERVDFMREQAFTVLRLNTDKIRGLCLTSWTRAGGLWDQVELFIQEMNR